ncbi:MAG: hypothetical protein ACYC09_15050 [Bacteroidota bacterium]
MKTYEFFTDRHHLTEEGVALYVDALRLERTAELPAEIRIHVEGCEECQRQIVESHEIMTAIPVDKSTPHPYFDRQIREPAVHYTPYRIAAAIAGVALLAAGYYAIVSRDTSPPVITQQDQSSSPREPDANYTNAVPDESTPNETGSVPMLADNFIESPNMEDLVHTDFRSTSVEVISPLNGDVVQTPIRFQWKASEEEMILKILTNMERTVLSKTVAGNAFTVERKLAPGLYYWKLETKKELVFTGKFLVR